MNRVGGPRRGGARGPGLGCTIWYYTIVRIVWHSILQYNMLCCIITQYAILYYSVYIMICSNIMYSCSFLLFSLRFIRARLAYNLVRVWGHSPQLCYDDRDVVAREAQMMILNIIIVLLLRRLLLLITIISIVIIRVLL